jgi:hypothetical protein
MVEFPEGKANFAEDEISFMNRQKKPENMAGHVREEYEKDKLAGRKFILDRLRDLAKCIDDPDPSYESVGREKGAEEK